MKKLLVLTAMAVIATQAIAQTKQDVMISRVLGENEIQRGRYYQRVGIGAFALGSVIAIGGLELLDNQRYPASKTDRALVLTGAAFAAGAGIASYVIGTKKVADGKFILKGASIVMVIGDRKRK